MDSKKLQIMFSDEQVKKIEDARKEIGVPKSVFFQNAVALFLWAIDEKKAGRSIASIDEKAKRIKEVRLIGP